MTPRRGKESTRGARLPRAWWHENGSAAATVDETSAARVRALGFRYGAGGWHASGPSLHDVLMVLADAASHDGRERDALAGTSGTADGKFDLHAAEDDTERRGSTWATRQTPAGTPWRR